MIDEVIKMKQNKNIVSIIFNKTYNTTWFGRWIYSKRIRQYCAFGDRRKIRKKNRKIIS